MQEKQTLLCPFKGNDVHLGVWTTDIYKYIY